MAESKVDSHVVRKKRTGSELVKIISAKPKKVEKTQGKLLFYV